ncbi:unnamed protein product [Symbiodinium sp. CCMP2456]|nr:unnamed protein product [Symbiodinium sp. CCMP2456]
MAQVSESLKTQSCQTDDVALVSHYPANLLFAQGMLNTTLLQLQQVERQISRLHEYVLEHRRLEACDKEVRRGCFGISSEAEAVVAAASALSAYAEAAQPQDAAAAAGQPAEAAPEAAPADAAAQRPLHRRRLSLLFKVGMVMILLEVRTGWYFLYILLALVYLGGMFDSWIEWFQNLANAQVTLEHQLNALRREQQAANEAAAGEPAEAAGESSEGRPQPSEADSSNGHRQAEGEAPRAHDDDNTAPDAPADAPAAPAAPQPRHARIRTKV